MSKRIGEVLVDKGLITPVQLEQSIKAQLIFGGHLGTNLIELGYVEESALGETLAETFRVGYATFEMLHNIPQHVIQVVPEEMAEKHRVIPLRQEDKTLHLAMIDPRNLSALDEISFMTGCRIVPWVAPEIRLFQALEKYYDLPRRLRYISICQELDKRIEEAERDRQRARKPVRKETGAAPAPSPPDDEPDVLELQERMGYGKSWEEVLEERAKDGGLDPVAPAWRKLQKAPLAADTDARTLEGVADALCKADSVDDLARVVTAHVHHRGGRSILFKVQADMATMWDADGLGDRADRAANFRLPVVSGSIFELLLGLDYYRGPVPEAPIYQLFYSMLGTDPPAEILMIPVHVNDRLVAILYVDGGTGASIPGDTEDYERLVRKLCLAMNMLVIKTRIHSV